MGRPRKPTNLKILEGAQPCRINRNEPKSPEGLSESPDWFDEFAIHAWGRLKKLLGPMGVSTRADEEAAMVYCQAYSMLRQATIIVNREGMMVESVTETTTKNGSTTRVIQKANPLLPTIRQAQRQMMQCLAHFGMTPSSRSGLDVAEKPEGNGLLEFIRDGKPRTPRAKSGGKAAH